MSNEISVLHYQDGSSDKIWAIRHKLNADGKYDVWYGRRNTTLRHDNVPSNPHWKSRRNEKMAKGYVLHPGVTIDTEQRIVVPLLQETEEEHLPTSLWYQVSALVIEQELMDFLDTTILNLAEDNESVAERLQKLPVFNTLNQCKLNGGAEYTEGPLALLLLFALRRHFRELNRISISDDLVHLADDNNNLVPDKFSDLEHYIEDMSQAANDYYPEDVIKDIAIAMGCMNAPINLSSLTTGTKAAFF